MFNYLNEKVNVIAAEFEKALTERNLPVQLEVLEENAEFLIKKISRRGDEQVSNNRSYCSNSQAVLNIR